MHEQGVEVNTASRNAHERCRGGRWSALSESPLVLPAQVAPVGLGLAVEQKVRADHPNGQLLGRPGRLIAVGVMTVLLSVDVAGRTDGRIGRTGRTPARTGPDAGGISSSTAAVRTTGSWRGRTQPIGQGGRARPAGCATGGMIAVGGILPSSGGCRSSAARGCIGPDTEDGRYGTATAATGSGRCTTGRA